MYYKTWNFKVFWRLMKSRYTYSREEAVNMKSNILGPSNQKQKYNQVMSVSRKKLM